MQTGKFTLHHQQGFTYLALLSIIAIMGIFLAQVGISWKQTAQREKEQELLFIGQQFRQAIMLYYLRTPGEAKAYPPTLQVLLLDNRFNPPARYLRKLYRDPITNTPEWGLLLAPQGGIMGVYSKSTTPPIKTANFSYENRTFEQAKSYVDWKFAYVDPNIQGGQSVKK